MDGSLQSEGASSAAGAAGAEVTRTAAAQSGPLEPSLDGFSRVARACKTRSEAAAALHAALCKICADNGDDPACEVSLRGPDETHTGWWEVSYDGHPEALDNWAESLKARGDWGRVQAVNTVAVAFCPPSAKNMGWTLQFT
jgi:hypothetical protein